MGIALSKLRSNVWAGRLTSRAAMDMSRDSLQELKAVRDRLQKEVEEMEIRKEIQELESRLVSAGGDVAAGA